jgi:lipopolysaccharide assembly outer membrane protein LptD (OstA)
VQKLGVRGTAYSLHRSEDDFLHRENLEYKIVTNTRLFKRYGSFTHFLEPSVSYHFITDSNNIPFFDATELFQKTSKIKFALLNRFTDERGEFMIMRVSQSYDTNIGDRPFLPLKLEVGIRRPLSLRFEASYDVHEGELENVNSDILMTISRATLSVGQRYNKSDDIKTLVAGIGINPSKSWNIGGRIWYDAEEREVRDIAMNIGYARKCWGLYMELYKRPGDFTAVIKFDLKGISQRLKI